MKIGLALAQFGPLNQPARLSAFSAAAEQLGYDSLWAADRLLTPVAPQDPYPGNVQPYPAEFTTALDPVVTLSVAAAATTRVRLGTSTLNAPQFNAVLLGRALTSIDALSDGRLEVGAGLGWLHDEYDAAGVPWAQRAARLDEMLDLWRAMWTQNPAEHRGEHFTLPESVIDLRPVQPGGPPILLAGATAGALRRVGRRAAGWLAVAEMPAAYARMLWDVARRAAEQAGRDPAALRRVVRINQYPGGPGAAELVERVAAEGHDEMFVDLTYVARDVDDALERAADLLDAVR